MSGRWIDFALVAAAIMGATAAQASTYVADLGGTGVGGRLALTYQPNPNTGPLGTSPNMVDPVGSFVVTGVSGTFSDAALGLTDAAITGLVALDRVSPTSTNLLAPNSFSLLPIAHGVKTPEGIGPGLHYDDLFYRAGSPQTASNYLPHGGVFDIYGIAFTIAGGDVVNLWSNGVLSQTGLDYGVAVTDRTDVLDYAAGVSVAAVPEPTGWALMAGGFGLLGLRLRRRVRVAFG